MNTRPLYLVNRVEEQASTLLPSGTAQSSKNLRLVALEVTAGDRILFGKYSGSEIKLDGTDYIIMREDDVLGIPESGGIAANKTT